MAAQACKIIINNLVAALMKALESILVSEHLHRGRIPERERLALIQRLADLDVATYTGNVELLHKGGLAGVVKVLEEYGLVTDEVWEILREPVERLEDHNDVD